MSSVVTLNPVAGFCVKSSSTVDGIYATRSSSLRIPKGFKVFINICWDSNVPPPPEGSEDTIRKAMIGVEDEGLDPDGWYVPVVVSEGKEATDKAGKPSLVFDAVFNSSLKSRSIKDSEFKHFLIELSIQRLEAETSILLSRQISSPNILSKGKLEQRTVRIPATISTDNNAPKKILIQEIPPANDAKHPDPKDKSKLINPIPSVLEEPSWTWMKNEQHILITISVPKLRRDLIASSTLDLESRRLLLHIPSFYSLDINLDLPDAQLQGSTLTLKRTRNLDVDGAKADWIVADRILVVTA